MSVKDSQDRQKRIRRPQREVIQPRPVSAASAPAGEGGGDFKGGKIIELNVHAEEVRIAPMIAGDPRDLSDWADDENFDIENAICAWTMGVPYCDVGWPAIAFLTGTGWWLWYAIKLLPDDAADDNPMCLPDGTLSPDLVPDCDPFENPSICSTRFACCLSTSDCREFNELECAGAGGQFYGPGTEVGGADGRHCESEEGGDVTCAPLWACVNPMIPNLANCVNMPDNECPPGFNQQACTCAEFFDPPMGCPGT